MNSKECEEQLKSLIRHYQNGGLDFNATDIEAIEHLLLENEMQHNTIRKQKKVIEKIREWEQNHTILVYTKNAPRELVGTHELLHILYEDKEVE